MTYAEIASRIVELVGTDKNVVSIMTCMTRLRIETFDKEKIDIEGLKQVEKVKGVTLKGNTVQIILLGELKDVYTEVEKITTTKEGVTIKVKQGLIDTVLDFLSGSFVPILPAIIGCGLLQGVMVAVNQFGWLYPAGSTHQILTLLGSAGLWAFPLFIAVSAAKKAGANQMVSLLLAAIMIHPTFSAWAGETQYMNYFGIPIRMVAYSSTILPMMLSVWVLKYIQIGAEKIVPKTLRTLLVPFIVLVIGIPLCLATTGPLGAYIGDVYSKFLDWLVTSSPVLTGLFLGGVSSLLVLTGLHGVAVSFIIMNLSATGVDYIYPIMKLSTIILGGIALGAWLSVKDKEEKAYCLSSWVLAFFGGLSEPSLYGVVVKYKRPFVPMIVTGMVIGTISVVSGVCCTTIAGGGWIFSLAAFMTCIPQYLICIALGTFGGAALTYLWGVEEPGILGRFIKKKEGK